MLAHLPNQALERDEAPAADLPLLVSYPAVCAGTKDRLRAHSEDPQPNPRTNRHRAPTAGASAMDGYSNDPDLKKIFEERALTPVAEMRGPWLGRMLHNSKSTDPRKIVLARDYHMPRKNIAKAMELVPDLQAICDENDVEMGVGVPVIASDHEMMRIIYRFKDLKHWGSATDAVIANPSFSELVDAANELGTLKHSRLIMMIK